MILMFGVTYVYSVAKIAYRSIPATMKSYPHPSTSRRSHTTDCGNREVVLRSCFCAVLATQANREGVQCKNGTPFGVR